MGVVDPRFRGRHLFERIKNFSYEDIRKDGVYGLFVEVVANHPYSQKANAALGARETGFMLGLIPPSRVFRGISGKDQERASVAVCYIRLDQEPEREVYPPFHHETVIRKIYDYGGFRRSIKPAAEADIPEPPERSLADLTTNADSGTAFLRVKTYGKDFERLIRARLRELCVNRLDCI